MKQINIVTNNPSQKMTLILESGQTINLTLFYSYNQSGWFYNLTYGNNFNVKGRRVVNSINMLRAFNNTIPFGLACLVSDNYEPIFIDDFANGRAKLYTLSQSDVDSVESMIGGV